jgi:hypothetical protein
MTDCLMIPCPESNLQVLEYLHTYRFLTAPQFFRLGVTSHIESTRRTLRCCLSGGRKYVAAAEFGALPRRGRLPRVYYLTKHGAELLADVWRVDPATINYPVGTPLYFRDYFHRNATTDFQIELRQFAGAHEAEVEFFHTYFDTRGANRSADPAARLQRLTKVPLGDSFFIPDAIFAVRPPDGSRYLYALEVYNGIDTGRVHRQLTKHRRALEEGRLSELHRYPQAHRVLCVFENDHALRAAAERLRADPAFAVGGMRNQFAFSTLDALRKDFATGWEFFQPGRACIFDTQP